MSTKTTYAPRLRVLQIIWLQQLVSLLIFGGVAFFINQGEEPNADNLASYAAACLVLAVVSIAVGLYVRRHYGGTVALPFVSDDQTSWEAELSEHQIAEVRAEAENVYKTMTIAGTAFSEIAAILGLALSWLVKMSILYAPFGGLAGVFILWQLPNPRSFNATCAALVKRKRSQGPA